MNLFDISDQEIPEPDLSRERVESMIQDIRRNDRNRRVAMMAPFVLVVAVIGTMFVAPSRYGGLDWVPEAGAVDEELPRVFGSNGVWKRPAPIAETTNQPTSPQHKSFYKNPERPDFSLVLPTRKQRNSFPVSTSPPPALILGQSQQRTANNGPKYELPILLAPAVQTPTKSSADSGFDPIRALDPTYKPPAQQPPASHQAQVQGELTTPAPPLVESAPPAEQATPVEHAQPAEQTQSDLVQADEIQGSADAGGTPDSLEQAIVVSSDMAPSQTTQDFTSEGSNEPDTTTKSLNYDDVKTPSVEGVSQPEDGSDLEQVKPSTSALGPDSNADIVSHASLSRREVMVRSAHVTVVVDLIAEQHSVIDWCGTWVDWGDSPNTQITSTSGDTTCAAQCEYVESSPGAGIDLQLTFSHEYSQAADISPKVHVATGTNCAAIEPTTLQLANFAVSPY